MAGDTDKMFPQELHLGRAMLRKNRQVYVYFLY